MSEIKAWLIEQVADELGIKPEEVATDEPFQELGLDSLSMTSISFELESKLGVDQISPTVFSEYDSIDKLVEWVESNNQ